jgi:hypothetical protein
MSNEKLNEGLFGAAKKFSDAFFDGLKSNATNTALNTAKKRGFPPKLQKQLDKVDRESKELLRQLADYQAKNK